MKRLALGLLLLGMPIAANAADGTFGVTEGSGTTIPETPDGLGSKVPHYILCDRTTPTQCLAVDSSGRLTLVPGFATSAKQPAPGTAGSPSADVITVQPPSSGSPAMPVTQSAVGIGDMTAMVSGSTNGTVLGTKPAGTTGVRIYLPSGTSVTFTIVASAPGSAPSAAFTVSCCTAGSTGPNWDENLAGTENVYITATTGSSFFRWR